MRNKYKNNHLEVFVSKEMKFLFFFFLLVICVVMGFLFFNLITDVSENINILQKNISDINTKTNNLSEVVNEIKKNSSVVHEEDSIPIKKNLVHQKNSYYNFFMYILIPAILIPSSYFFIFYYLPNISIKSLLIDHVIPTNFLNILKKAKVITDVNEYVISKNDITIKIITENHIPDGLLIIPSGGVEYIDLFQYIDDINLLAIQSGLINNQADYIARMAAEVVVNL